MTKATKAVLSICGVLAIGLLAYFVIAGSNSPEQAWIVLAVLGVSIFLVVLTIMAFTFKFLNLDNNKEALGLPPGSIRAVIALCLVVVFVIFVIFLYNDLANPHSRTLTNISQEQYNKISADQILMSTNMTDKKTGEITYNVELSGSPKSSSAQDLAKQVVTLVGTLMAAVSSFYFGTKAAEQKETEGKAASKKEEGNEENPTIKLANLQSPTTRDPGNSSMSIKLAVSPEDETIECDKPLGDSGAEMTQTGPGEFLYKTGSNPDAQVLLLFRLVKHPDVITTLLIETPKFLDVGTAAAATLPKDKGKELTIKLNITPKGEKIKFNQPEGDANGVIKQIDAVTFTYTRGDAAANTVKLTFFFAKYPHIKYVMTVSP